MKDNKGKKPMTMVGRGLTGAAVGFVFMLVVMIATNSGGSGFGLHSLAYLAAGPLYGFGFVFANWHYVIQKTKVGAIEGAAGLGIGLVLAHLFRNRNWGIAGMLYFLLRVSWHIGFCWIPGIWYGIRAIREERRQERPAKPQKERREDRPAAAPAGARRSSTPAAAARPQAPSTPAGQARPQAPSTPAAAARPKAPSARPQLTALSGLFSGGVFSAADGEELLIGSDPEVCQIVLPPECAAPIHCSLVFDRARGVWRARDLTEGQTLFNGARAARVGEFQDMASGTVLSLGHGANRQQFQLG